VVGVTVEKLSVSLPGVVVARARRAAERAGVPLSSWLAEAAAAAADVADARAAAEEYVAQFGEPDPAEAAAVRADLAAAGFGQPEPAVDIAARQAVLARLLGIEDDRRAR
jgi:hypothetical protein